MSLPERRKALFLDRDGVINVDRQYVYRVEDFEFVPGIFELCAAAADLGYLLVVATNQAGIGRGLYTEADFERLTSWMIDTFREHGLEIARVYHCPYHPTAGVGVYRQESFDRKPSPGMLLRARDDLHLDLAGSIFIGDNDSDMRAGAAAGIGCLLHLKREPGPTDDAAHDVVVVTTLEQATQWVRRQAGADGDPRDDGSSGSS